MTPRQPARKTRRRTLFLRMGALLGGSLTLLSLGGLLVSGCVSKPVSALQGTDGSQSIKVTVKHGYSPNVIEAKAGKPLKVEFYRDEEAGAESCVKDLEIPAENVNIPLPVHESQIVEIKPHAPGEIVFQCGMDMMHGKIIFK